MNIGMSHSLKARKAQKLSEWGDSLHWTLSTTTYQHAAIISCGIKKGVSEARMTKLQTNINSLDILIKEHYLDGTDTINGFQFMIQFFRKADKMHLLEEQVYLVLAIYLLGLAQSQISSIQNSFCSRGIISWPKVIQFFLRY